MLLFHKSDRAFNVLFSEAYLRRISFSKQNIKTFVLFLRYFSALTLLCFMLWFLFLRLQQPSIERVMDLTDSFTWEDLPTRDADTGHLTVAGWIPLTMKYSVRVAIAVLCVHIVQSTIRMVKNHETMLVAWYPFDWNVSPFYELVNISQVTFYINKLYKNLIRNLLYYS